ncbi:MAG: hypothetical protein ACI8Y7_000921 [Candidatus Woesearchaeota archaeon]|jgi:hypothetical protein
MSLSVVVMMVVVTIAGIAGFSIFSELFAVTLDVTADPNILTCQQNAVLVGQIRIPVINQEAFAFTCPVSFTKITIDDLKVSKKEALKVTDYGYASTEGLRFALDKKMWEESRDCYRKVNFGKNSLFSRSSMLKILDSQSPTYCVICSVVEFDDTIKASVGSQELTANRIFFQEPYKEGKNLPDYVDSVRDEDTIGFLDMKYHVNERQVVIYKRANLDVGFKTTAQFINWALATSKKGVAAILISPPLSAVGLIVNALGYTGPLTDFESVEIINYPVSSRGEITSHCDLLANTFED